MGESQLKSKLEAGIAGYYKKPYWKHYDYWIKLWIIVYKLCIIKYNIKY